jgi:hypothetical protein
MGFLGYGVLDPRRSSLRMLDPLFTLPNRSAVPNSSPSEKGKGRSKHSTRKTPRSPVWASFFPRGQCDTLPTLNAVSGANNKVLTPLYLVNTIHTSSNESVNIIHTT